MHSNTLSSTWGKVTADQAFIWVLSDAGHLNTRSALSYVSVCKVRLRIIQPIYNFVIELLSLWAFVRIEVKIFCHHNVAECLSGSDVPHSCSRSWCVWREGQLSHCALYLKRNFQKREGFKKDSNTFVRKFLSMILNNFSQTIFLREENDWPWCVEKTLKGIFVHCL